MNTSAYILEYLKQFGAVTVPGFGVFSLENSKAVINSENGSILPPASTIVYHPDYEAQSDELAFFIGTQKQMSLEASRTDLQIQTDFWKKRLQSEHVLEIQGLGTMYAEESGTVFKGARLQSDHPDFYGLEEIRLSDIGSTELAEAAPEKGEKDYRFNKSILWAFLIIIPVAGILAVAYFQQDLLFGKKSFDKVPVSVQTSTHRIEKDTVKVRAYTPPAEPDSLKKDSAALRTVQPAAGKIPSAAIPKNNTKTK
ncbi:hypothetical protein [uncultured Chryseobacterium sp.]|uniref:hypothetical protein n=1 Tax=uncultured Chryseobacterium sp. TaxID=259322 RepID=UPI0025F17C35|nr:hypothetical protein [uncultured Chryseobacterium sp.]